LQHLQMTRDVAARFHAQMGETFVMPEARVQENSMHIPGTDGEKMSKSKGNLINIFLPDKQLRKQIMGIVTDSTPMENPKNPETDTVFKLYRILATAEQTAAMRANYEGGNYGYGHAKQALYELLISRFGDAREQFHYFMAHPDEVDEALQVGATKAQKVANGVLERVRSKLGY